jgi:hypothetical protein
MMVNQDGTAYLDDPLSPYMLGQRDAQRGRPAPPLYDSRAEAHDYASGWYEHSARPAPDTLPPTMVEDPVTADAAADYRAGVPGLALRPAATKRGATTPPDGRVRTASAGIVCSTRRPACAPWDRP